jgi:hypothetical protein
MKDPRLNGLPVDFWTRFEKLSLEEQKAANYALERFLFKLCGAQRRKKRGPHQQEGR